MSFTYTEEHPPDPEARFEFTEDGFARILDFAAARFSFVRFGDAPQPGSVLWRHDIDMSVHRAAALARIEQARGVTATYFFRLHSEYYNVFEWPTRDLIQDIASRGHVVGLHFEADPRQAIPDEDSLEEKLEAERAILEEVAEGPVEAFSFHNPQTHDLLRFRRDKYAKMANAYAYLGEAGYVYVSDSNGYWRFRSVPDVLAENLTKSVHVLTHPEWWTPDAMPPRARMQRCVQGRAVATEVGYDALLTHEGRINVR
ncbi:MAG TPA: hypothetical protein VEV45_03330 [Streptosporangiaceae bacterium]|nr:hypothetical protein [Streptosporangiaceae bacterium]